MKGEVRCSWSCGKCGVDGVSVVFPYSWESPSDTAERFQRGTRELCLEGCLFQASPEASSALLPEGMRSAGEEKDQGLPGTTGREESDAMRLQQQPANADAPYWEKPRYSPDGFRHPITYGVERHPNNPHRFLLQFDRGEKMEIDAHQALTLIDMMAGFLRGCIGSEVERELGRAAKAEGR